MSENIDRYWLGINISYDELEIKKALNGSDFKDLFKFIANGERNKSRKVDTSKDISEDEFNEMVEVMKLNPNQMPRTIADVNRFKKGEEGLSRVYEWEGLSPEVKTQAKLKKRRCCV